MAFTYLAKSRKHNSDSRHSQTEWRTPASALLRRIAGKIVEPAKVTRQTIKGSPRVLYSDEQIAHIRWLYEHGNWSMQRIAETYDLNYDYVYKVVSYLTRSKVMAKRSATPNLFAKA